MTLQPRRPNGPGWVRLPLPLWAECPYPHEFWQHDSGICAVSVAMIAGDASQRGRVVMYQVVLSRLGAHPCSDDETLWALREFRLVETTPPLH